MARRFLLASGLAYLGDSGSVSRARASALFHVLAMFSDQLLSMVPKCSFTPGAISSQMPIRRRGNEPLPQNLHEVHSDQTSLITLPVPSLNQSLSGRVTHSSGLSYHVPHTKVCSRDPRAPWTEGGRSGADLLTNLTHKSMNAGEAKDAAYQRGPGLCQQPPCRLDGRGEVRETRQGVGWQWCVRGLVSLDKEFRLFLGGSGEIYNREREEISQRHRQPVR